MGTPTEARKYNGPLVTHSTAKFLREGQRAVEKERPGVVAGLDTYLDNFFAATGRTRVERNLVKTATGLYVASRFDRAEDLDSPDVVEARRLASEYFQDVVGEDKVEVSHCTCMDCRTRKTLETGVPGGFGQSHRSPGGRPDGFSKQGFGRNPGLKLEGDSDFAKISARPLKSGMWLVQMVDSHEYCARRSDGEGAIWGQKPEDWGVLEDRRYKGRMIKAMQEHMTEQGIGQKLVSVRYSFNPQRGYLSLLDEQKYEKVVANTEELATGRLDSIFADNAFNLDWVGNYQSSAINFWRNLTGLEHEAMPIVKEELGKVYSDLRRVDPIKFAFKCKVALANAYSGWLHNLNRDYPHGVHIEDLVVQAAGGEHGPFDIEALETPRDGVNYRPDTMYQVELARGFRTIGEKTTPVPLIIQWRLDLPQDAAQESAELIRVISDDLPTSGWQNLSYEEGQRYIINSLRGKGRVLTAELADAMAKMFGTMARVFDPKINDDYGDALYAGSFVPIPMIVDANLGPLAVPNLFKPAKK